MVPGRRTEGSRRRGRRRALVPDGRCGITSRGGRRDDADRRLQESEREVSAYPVIVREIAGQDAVQVRFTEDEDMIQTLAPDRADEPLRAGVLPRALGRGWTATQVITLTSHRETVISQCQRIGTGTVECQPTQEAR